MFEQGKYYLISYLHLTAEDGLQYDAVYGKAEILSTEKILGFSPSKYDSNFVVKVTGTTDKTLFIAGCEIRFVLQCNEKPEIVVENKDEYRRDIAKIYFI